MAAALMETISKEINWRPAQKDPQLPKRWEMVADFKFQSPTGEENKWHGVVMVTHMAEQELDECPLAVRVHLNNQMSFMVERHFDAWLRKLEEHYEEVQGGPKPN